jgi:hypothetical protein
VGDVASLDVLPVHTNRFWPAVLLQPSVTVNGFAIPADLSAYNDFEGTSESHLRTLVFTSLTLFEPVMHPRLCLPDNAAYAFNFPAWPVSDYIPFVQVIKVPLPGLLVCG